jgi:hypothetical protein
MDRRSRPGFAKIIRLEADGFNAAQIARALQGDEELLNFVEFHIIAREARNIMGKPVALRSNVSHMILLGEFPDAGGGRALDLSRHALDMAIAGLKIH